MRTAASCRGTHPAPNPFGLQMTGSHSGGLRGVTLHCRGSLASSTMGMWQGHHALHEPVDGNG